MDDSFRFLFSGKTMYINYNFLKLLFCASLFFLMSAITNAEESDEEIFSQYSGEFTVANIYGSPRVTRFNGEVLVTGEMVFRFDQISETEMGELMFADFIPDEEYISMFPQVEQGFYAKSLKSVSITNAVEALSKVFEGEALEKIKHSTSGVISNRGAVLLNEYSVFVECDSRQYTAHVVSFEQENDLVSTQSIEDLSGC